MSVFDDIKSIVKGELNAEDLGTLKSAFDAFIKGTPEEQAAATAIATNVKDAIQAYMDGTLSKHSLEFVLVHSRDATVMLAEAKSIRLRKAAIRAFFKVVIAIAVKAL